MIAVAVAACGAVGAVARWLLDAAVTHHTRELYPNRRLARGPFPYGTLFINVAGSLLLGVLTGLVVHDGAPLRLVTIAGTGFCGGFTTWSTFVWESHSLFRPGQRQAAFAHIGVHLAACLAAATLGLVLTGA